MKKNDVPNKPDSTIPEDFTIDTLTPETPDSKDLSDLDSKSYTYTSEDCCFSDTCPTTITNDPCKIWNKEELQVDLTCQGRILTINIKLKNVCPNKKLAIGVLLYKGEELKAFKAKEITTPSLPKCHEKKDCLKFVSCKFCFIIPGSLCHPLTLKPKVIAHYSDIEDPIY